MVSSRNAPAVVLVVFLILGCGGATSRSDKDLASMAGGSLKKVVPVGGKVSIDGEPKGGVNLYLFPSKGGAQIAEARTNPDGTYCWTTHTACDGLEAGDYKLAFRYIPKQKRNDNNIAKDDQLNGKFSDPKKVDYPLTVETGKPQTDVDYDLKTK